MHTQTRDSRWLALVVLCAGMLMVILDQTPQRRREDVTLGLGQRSEDVGEDALHEVIAVLRERSPGVGDGDDPRPPVVGGGTPLDEPALLELVDGDDHRRLVELAELGELDLRAIAFDGLDQHALLARREAEVLEPGGQLRLQRVRGEAEEHRQIGNTLDGRHDTRITRSVRHEIIP